MARADAKGANLAAADLTDTNCYATSFDGATARGRACLVRPRRPLPALRLPAAASSPALPASPSPGADLRGATFENSILTSASFGKGPDGQWAQLQGTHFEGALVSSSDVGRICENPTLEDSTKKFELGCRLPRK
jgi:uncharacterized protein YjbI with pentapeptide repeats